MPRHGIDECAVEIAGTRMHDHSGRLVDDHQRVVFIDDVERNVLGLDGGIVARTVEHQRDDVARTNLVIAFHRSIVDMDEARIGSLLDAVARRMLHLFLHIFVDAQRSLSRIDYEAEMLVKLLILSGFSVGERQFVQIFVVHRSIYN